MQCYAYVHLQGAACMVEGGDQLLYLEKIQLFCRLFLLKCAILKCYLKKICSYLCRKITLCNEIMKRRG